MVIRLIVPLSDDLPSSFPVVIRLSHDGGRRGFITVGDAQLFGFTGAIRRNRTGWSERAVQTSEMRDVYTCSRPPWEVSPDHAPW
jgi:hypothetical protein